MKKRLLASVLALVMMFALVACGGNDTANVTGTSASSEATPAAEAAAESAPGMEASSDAEPFVIGSYLQMTGANNSALFAKNAIDMALKTINAEGGFNGHPVEMLYYDTTGSTEEAVKVVQKMLTDDKVDAIIGSVNSNEVAACINYINDAKVWNFGLGTSATWMADESMIYTFRAAPNNGRVVPLDAAKMKELGYTSVAIMNSTDDTASSTADSLEAACAEQGIAVTTRQQCDSEDTDFTGQIAHILESDPDLIYMTLLSNHFGPFVKQLRNSGYTGQIATVACYTSEYQAVAGMSPNTDYIWWVYPYVTYSDVNDCNIPIMKKFQQEYLDTYGVLPEHETCYRAYDTILVMWEASKIAGSNDSEALREATHKVQMEGLGGKIDYTDGSREAYSSFNSFILVNNKSVLLDDWLSSGGLEEYQAVSGRER